MGIKKTLGALAISLVSLFNTSKADAQTFIPQVIDDVPMYTNPATKIDDKGVKYSVWRRSLGGVGLDMVHANSSDNFKTRYPVPPIPQAHYPSIDMDSEERIQLAANLITGLGEWKTVYTYLTPPPTGQRVYDLGSGYPNKEIDLAVNRTIDRVYVASQKDYGSDVDIVLTYFQNYENSPPSLNQTDIRIQAPGNQFNPRIEIDQQGIVHLVYLDYKEGLDKFKVVYRSSLDDFFNEQIISKAKQSHGADLKIDDLGNPWVVFKETDLKGNIFLADLNSNWEKRKVTSLEEELTDKPTRLAIGPDGTKYMVWSSLTDDGKMAIRYASGGGVTVQTPETIDIGTNIGLGWSEIVVDAYGNPYIFANIHSLVEYSPSKPIPEPTTLLLFGLGYLEFVRRARREREQRKVA